MLGALCSRTAHRNPPKPQPWTFTVGYRYQPSSRHFIGTVEQKQREINNNQIQNVYHMLDFSVSRQMSRRWQANASLPLIFAYRNQLYVPRGEFRVDSIGDATVGARVWLFRPPTESGGNIGVGMNLKLPTGNYNATGPAKNALGQPIIATADQSIQTGDGRTGFSLDAQAYKPIPWTSMLYFTGSYLFNPADTNGVYTFRNRPAERYMSVADQYLARGGVSHGFRKIPGFTVMFGGRVEGVPVRDLIGKSSGFRRPGYAVSLDPGFMYARNSYVFSCGVPFAVRRNRQRSVSDIATSPTAHGDAAFADYSLIIGFSKRF